MCYKYSFPNTKPPDPRYPQTLRLVAYFVENQIHIYSVNKKSTLGTKKTVLRHSPTFPFFILLASCCQAAVLLLSYTLSLKAFPMLLTISFLKKYWNSVYSFLTVSTYSQRKTNIRILGDSKTIKKLLMKLKIHIIIIFA